ncbi:MAG: hypothetical protein WC878_05180 [Candidatus Paceibacterota bacterium]|jgi:hypothetical protein
MRILIFPLLLMMKTNLKKIIGISAVTILSVTVLGYSYFRTKDFLKGPVLEISAPKNGEIFDTALIKISGASKNLAFLNLDGRKIFTDKEGNWSEKLLLQPGLNIIEIQATDRFGREVKRTRQVVYTEE